MPGGQASGVASENHSPAFRTENVNTKVTDMKNLLLSFLRDEQGLTTVEYAVAGALITVAVVAAFTQLGGSVAGTIGIIDGVLPG